MDYKDCMDKNVQFLIDIKIYFVFHKRGKSYSTCQKQQDMSVKW